MNIKKYFIFFRRAKIIYKMVMGSLIFIIPIGILLNFTIKGFNYHIDFAKRELIGVELLKPIKALINYIPEYSFLKEQNKKKKNNKTREKNIIIIEKLKNEIEISFKTLIEKYKNYADTIELNQENMNSEEYKKINPENIFEAWSKLQISNNDSVSDNSKQQEDNDITDDLENLNLENIENKNVVGENENETTHIQIEEDSTIDNLNLLLNKIGNKSKLLHDPDIKSYHSMDTALLIMPRLHYRILEFKSKRLRNIRTASSKELMQDFTQLSYELQSGLEKININNPFEYKKYDKIMSGIIRYLESIATKRYFDKKKFISELNKTINAYYKFWGDIVNDLENKIILRKNSNQKKKFAAIVISLVSFLLPLIIAIMISFGISAPLKSIITISEDIAQGKIGIARDSLDKIISKEEDMHLSNNELDKLLISIDVMTQNIDSLLTQVTKSSAQVTTSASQIAGSARQLEATVAEQASSTNEVAAMSKEISKTSNNLSETMQNVTKMVVDASDDAVDGNDKLNSIKETMETLLISSDEISEKLTIIKQKTDNINQVITTVTKVANQTNLLSLNAAIEAEKAGEYGIGFAVVAREIRRLADQTAVATLDIENMITEMQVAVNDGTSSVEKFGEQVKKDSENINGISENLSGIIDKTSELRPEFEDVYKGMQLQTQNSEQINETMDQLNEVATHTRDSAIEFKKATDILNGAIKELQDEVTKFLVGE